MCGVSPWDPGLRKHCRVGVSKSNVLIIICLFQTFCNIEFKMNKMKTSVPVSCSSLDNIFSFNSISIRKDTTHKVDAVTYINLDQVKP